MYEESCGTKHQGGSGFDEIALISNVNTVREWSNEIMNDCLTTRQQTIIWANGCQIKVLIWTFKTSCKELCKISLKLEQIK